jgi:(p)ppGpp synthase/HD superfamily hydrolase
MREMESELVKKAANFAQNAHQGAVRKYNGAPYITHPARVAAAVANLEGATSEMVAAAWLHDVVEDTTITLDVVQKEFGEVVAHLVKWLTNDPKVPGENRAARKKKNAVRLSGAPKDAQKIKMLDRMDNLREMDLVQDRGFAKVYLEESWDLLYAVGNSDRDLAERFEAVLNMIGQELGIEKR